MKRRLFGLVAFSVLVFFARTNAAHATTVQVNFSGELTSVQDDGSVLHPSIAPTAAFFGNFLYDIGSAPDSDPADHIGDYLFSNTMSVQIGVVDFTSDSLLLSVFDGQGTGGGGCDPRFDDCGQDVFSASDTGFSSAGLAIDEMGIDLTDLGGTIFFNDDPPISFGLDDFSDQPPFFPRRFSLTANGGDVQIVGTLTALTAVPEPSTALLLCLTAILLPRTSRRRS